LHRIWVRLSVLFRKSNRFRELNWLRNGSSYGLDKCNRLRCRLSNRLNSRLLGRWLLVWPVVDRLLVWGLGLSYRLRWFTRRRRLLNGPGILPLARRFMLLPRRLFLLARRFVLLPGGRRRMLDWSGTTVLLARRFMLLSRWLFLLARRFVLLPGSRRRMLDWSGTTVLLPRRFGGSGTGPGVFVLLSLFMGSNIGPCISVLLFSGCVIGARRFIQLLSLSFSTAKKQIAQEHNQHTDINRSPPAP